ncbi:MAG: hypothetical protein ACLGHN_09430 [Bacteriovoracia bacterium]
MKKLFAVILSLGLIMSPVPVVSNAHAGEGGGYAKQILGMANGIMGGSILMKCKMGSSQMSILVYMAGGLVYVAGEILGGKTQGKKQKSQAKDLESLKANMTEGGDYQKAMIKAQIDDEKTTLETIKKRRKWMLATKVVYGIATVLAILELWWSFPYPVGIAKPYEGACQGGTPSHKPMELAIIAAYSSLLSANGDLKGAAMNLAMGALAKFVLKIEIGNTIADKAIGILSTAYGRIAFFGASAILVQVIDSGLAKEEKKSEKRIEDLEKVLAQFEAADNSIDEGSLAGATEYDEGKDDKEKKKKHNLKELGEGLKVAKHCYTNTSKGPDYSEAGCKNPMKLNRPKFDSNMNIPTIVAGANLAADMGQAVANGDTASADVSAGQLASMAGRVDKIQGEMMKRLNDHLKAEGKKPIDINAELARQVTALNEGLNKAEPGSGNFSLADIMGGEAGVSDDVNKGDTNPAADIKSEKVADAVPVGAGGGLDLSGLEEAADEADGLGADGAGNVASLSDSLSEFESNESDISKETGVSIFKQLSNRYFLNYTKIFDRKKVAPPLKEPEPAQP